MNAPVTETPALVESLQRFAPQRITTPGGDIEFRRAGSDAITHVLLHGIGSGSASWLKQLEAADQSRAAGVLVWEAPGYGKSAPVIAAQPEAAEYAGRLWQWLDAMEVQQPVTLVGHSLGALMVARAAVQQPSRIARLVLLSPAQGYARAEAADRQKRLDDRLNTLTSLGLHGMAQKRGAAMLSPAAAPEAVAYVQWVMSQLNAAGYTQAVHLLMGGDLLTDVAQVACPIAVASGDADTITPPAGCQKVAAAAGVEWQSLGNAGHACALDAFEKVNALLGL